MKIYGAIFLRYNSDMSIITSPTCRLMRFLLSAWAAPASAIRFEAITLGHIVLGLNHTVLETHRLHEHAHVRQYERWGMLFFPLYLGSSLAQLLRGRDPHCYNHFERKAFMNAASATKLLSRVETIKTGGSSHE